MPLFEFTCATCGKTFEELVGSSLDTAGLTCPACGSEDVEKLFSTFSSSGPSEGGTDGGRACGGSGKFT